MNFDFNNNIIYSSCDRSRGFSVRRMGWMEWFNNQQWNMWDSDQFQDDIYFFIHKRFFVDLDALNW